MSGSQKATPTPNFFRDANLLKRFFFYKENDDETSRSPKVNSTILEHSNYSFFFVCTHQLCNQFPLPLGHPRSRERECSISSIFYYFSYLFRENMGEPSPKTFLRKVFLLMTDSHNMSSLKII